MWIWFCTTMRADAAPLKGAHRLVAQTTTSRLITIGEAPHWTSSAPQVVGELVQRMCAAGTCPDLVALECPYSASPWLDAYVREREDDLAQEHVAENVQDTIAAYQTGLGGAVGFHEGREAAMTRNLTDTERLGRFWIASGRAVFYGGAAHTSSAAFCERDWLACRLRYEDGPLQDSVRSLLIRVVFLDLLSIPALDPPCAQAGTAYLTWLQSMRSFRDAGGASGPVQLGASDKLQRLARSLGRRAVWWRGGPAYAMGHDDIIIVPVSAADTPACDAQ